SIPTYLVPITLHIYTHHISLYTISSLFSYNVTSTTEIYTLSLHDALPISNPAELLGSERLSQLLDFLREKYDFIILDAPPVDTVDRKSTRLNSSHVSISYAVFCLKKKKIICEYHKNN